MKIYFLGTGAAVATAKRDNTSIYFETDSWNLLVDCPGSVIYKFSLLSIDYTKLNGIFITHSHPDHLYGLPSVIHSLDPFDIHPKVFIPKGIITEVKSLLKIFNLQNKTEIISMDYKIDEYESIDFFSTNHTPYSKGIKIFSENNIIIYTSDTGPIPECEKIFKNADYLIHDCYAPARLKKVIPALDSTHTSAETLGKIAEKSKVKHLIPIHFSGEHDFEISEIAKEIKKYYCGDVIIPEDLMMLKV